MEQQQSGNTCLNCRYFLDIDEYGDSVGVCDNERLDECISLDDPYIGYVISKNFGCIFWEKSKEGE